eukprot:14507251-Alexandrium_andersonii.AAC.1
MGMIKGNEATSAGTGVPDCAYGGFAEPLNAHAHFNDPVQEEVEDPCHVYAKTQLDEHTEKLSKHAAFMKAKAKAAKQAK